MSQELKAGLCQHEWMARFSRVFPTRIFKPSETEAYAFNAWDCAEPDQEPEEAAEAELTHMLEDSI
jgi:hypothetical protein